MVHKHPWMSLKVSSLDLILPITHLNPAASYLFMKATNFTFYAKT